MASYGGTISGWLALVFVSAGLTACAGPDESATLAIIHATVIDGSAPEAKSDQTLLVKDGRIQEMGPSDSIDVPSEATVIDATGRHVIPGLWDVHAHTNADQTVLDLYLANGVTSIRDMGCDPRCAELLAERSVLVASDSIVGPRVVWSGPNIDGASPIDYAGHVHVTVAGAATTVEDLKAAGADFIKVRDWLAPDEYAAVLAASHIQGLPVDGHVPTSMTVTAVAAAGQRTVEHGGSVLGGLLLAASSDEEGLRAELLAAMDAARTSGQFFAPFALAMGPDFTDRLLRTFDESKASLIVEAFREAGTALVPTLVVGHPAFRSVDPEFDGRRVLEGRQMDYVSGDVLEMWKASATSPLFAGEGIQAARDRYEALADLVGRMHRAGVPVLPGTDLSVEAPWQVAGFSLHDELLLLVEAGLSPMDAIRAATSTPATVLGLIDLGTVEVGKLADLVILDADPLTDIRNTRRIAGVVSRGIYLGRPALDSLLNAAEEVASGARN